MTVPVVEGFLKSDTGGVISDTITMDRVSGIVSGELLKVIICNDNSFSSHGFQAVTGWTGPESGITGGDNTGDCKIGVYWREADGTEPATQDFTFSTNWRALGWYIRVSGADTTSPFDVKASAPDVSVSTSHPITGVTTTVADCLAFYGLAFDGGDGDPFSVSGTGWTESAEGDAGSSSGAGASGCWGTRAMASAGATGTATVTSNVSDGSAGSQWAIAPEAGGATNPKGPLGHPLHGPFGGPI